MPCLWLICFQGHVETVARLMQLGADRNYRCQCHSAANRCSLLYLCYNYNSSLSILTHNAAAAGTETA